MVCRSAFSRLPTAQSKIEARHRCLQPATSRCESYGFRHRAAETLHSRVFGAYHQVEPRERRNPCLPLMRKVPTQSAEGEITYLPFCAGFRGQGNGTMEAFAPRSGFRVLIGYYQKRAAAHGYAREIFGEIIARADGKGVGNAYVFNFIFRAADRNAFADIRKGEHG